MSGLTQRHEGILEARGFDVELLATLSLESLDKGDGRDWISIPYFRNGEVVNRKIRTIAPPGAEYDKRFHQDAGAEKIFYGHDVMLDRSLAGEPLIICEGELDRWSFMQAGYLRVVSVPDGAPQKAAEGDLREARETKYSFLFGSLAEMKDIHEIILATDDDKAGHILRDEMGQILGRARCKWLPYPKGCKDANEVLQRYGVKGIKASIERASWMRLEGVYALSELPPADSRIAYPTGMASGALDRRLKVRLGDVMVVTGVPNQGKSAFLNDLCCSLNMLYGWRIAWFSPEQEAASEHRDNLRQWFCKYDPSYLDQSQTDEADAWINENHRFIVANDEDELNIDWLMDKAEGAIVRAGCKVVVIDPWNELEHIYPNGMTENDYTGMALRAFGRWARRHKILLVIAAHPKKIERLSDGTYKVPCAYDISGSANWFNKPASIVIVHRGRHGTLIRVEKSKNHRTMGTPGDEDVTYDTLTGRYRMAQKADDAPSQPGRPLYSVTQQSLIP